MTELPLGTLVLRLSMTIVGLGILLAGCESLATQRISTQSSAVGDLIGDPSDRAPVTGPGTVSRDRETTDTTDTAAVGDDALLTPIEPDQNQPRDPQANDDDPDDQVITETDRVEVGVEPNNRIKEALSNRLFEFQIGENEEKLGLVTYRADGTFEWSTIDKKNRKTGKWWTRDGQYCDDSGDPKYFDGRRSQCVDFGETEDDLFLANTRLRPL